MNFNFNKEMNFNSMNRTCLVEAYGDDGYMSFRPTPFQPLQF